MKRKKKKIIFIRTHSINPDPRVEKEAGYLLKDYNIEILGWDRQKECQKEENRNGYKIHRYQIRGFCGRGLRNVIGLIGWSFYEFFWLIFQKFDILHACDFDTYLPALLIAKIKNKKIVYDIFDFYSEMILNVPLFVKKIIRKLDIFLIQFADGVIIADENRKKQIKDSKPKRLAVIYNTPEDYYQKFKNNIEITRQSKNFVLGYVGLLRKERGLDVIVEALRELPDVKLVIGGFGPYAEEFKKRIRNFENIEFLGKVFPYERTLEVLSKCDVLFALYDPEIPNHKYSSPNKLFEAMMLAKPIIISRNTGMDKIVEKYKCGIVVDYDNHYQLREAILKLKEMKEKGDNFYGKNGREAYLNTFHPDVMRNRLLKLYKEVLC